RRFCATADRPDLAADPRYASNSGRLEHRDELVAEIAVTMAQRSSAFWMQALEAVGVPCGPINELDAVFADPQVQARGIRFDLDPPPAGRVPQVASPLRLSATPVAYDRAPPLLGQHTEEVLAERLRLDASQIAALRAAGVI